MKNTHEKLLRDKENRIKTWISHGTVEATKTFNFLHSYYMLNELSGKTPIISVFEAIYIKKLNLPAWKLANKCNLSRTTLFNYRNAIVKDFYICLSQGVIFEETSTTDGDDI